MKMLVKSCVCAGKNVHKHMIKNETILILFYHCSSSSHINPYIKKIINGLKYKKLLNTSGMILSILTQNFLTLFSRLLEIYEFYTWFV